MYTSLSHGEFQLIRQTLLIFFQDMHIRVSLTFKECQILFWVSLALQTYSCLSASLIGVYFPQG